MIFSIRREIVIAMLDIRSGSAQRFLYKKSKIAVP